VEAKGLLVKRDGRLLVQNMRASMYELCLHVYNSFYHKCGRAFDEADQAASGIKLIQPHDNIAHFNASAGILSIKNYNDGARSPHAH
jgi:hypothetical protein